MAQVTYDDNSYLIDGKRVWLVSGSVHYFRVPADLWRDRLLKAKRAGLNCITTYVPWNYHEAIEGRWNFEGDRDVAEFVRIAGELGLYVILRPGPYICAEWDFGGLPGWLTTKTGMTLRTNNAAFMHYFDKYFAQLLPRLADQQVTRGGNIILIQNENEYIFGDSPNGRAYLEFVSQLIRRGGFDIPIISCNMFAGPQIEGVVDNINSWDAAVEGLKRAHYSQPMMPMIVTEFWSGWFDFWGSGIHERRDPREVARRAMEMLGCGAQYNYYMFHGGTNFGFWGSRLVEGEATYQTTSYDYDAPLAEGGELTEKYYLTRLVNMMANHMARFLASAFMEDPGVTIHDNTDVRNLTGPLGRWAVITNGGCDDITDVNVSLPKGEERLKVPLGPFGAVAVPIDVALTPTVTLDHTNLTPLGLFGEKVLVLHGPASWAGEVKINGEQFAVEVPGGIEPTLLACGEIFVAVISSELACKTWFVDDLLIFGPDFVGETAEDVTMAKGATHYILLSLDGKISRRKIKTPTSQPRATTPRLGTWRRVSVCGEPIDESLQWKKIERPRSADQLGVPQGYLWYRIEVRQKQAGRRYLFLPDCADRATIFLNGKHLGVWGRGPDAARTPIGANFKRGENVLTILVDNLGRFSVGPRMGELKGLYGHIYDAKALPMKKFKLTKGESFSKRLVPHSMAHLAPLPEKGPLTAAETDISMKKVTPIHLTFKDIPHHVAVLCNDKPVGLFPMTGEGSFGDVTLSSELKSGKNVIKLLLWGEATAKSLAGVKFYSLSECITSGAKWLFRPWTLPQEGGRVVGKSLPAWYSTSFKYTEAGQPLYLHILAAKKGQIYVNGRNIGRFWTTGPQDCYYLPECWLAENNQLLLFSEGGENPSTSRLERHTHGPFND